MPKADTDMQSDRWIRQLQTHRHTHRCTDKHNTNSDEVSGQKRRMDKLTDRAHDLE